MKLRVARHTQNLQALIEFYTGIIGLTVLGSFKDHAGYDGVFIGDGDWHWHLEFTISAEAPQHEADEDDLLVFYADTQSAYQQIIDKATAHNMEQVAAKNPYWRDNGVMLKDPDGFRVMIIPAKS